MDDEKRVSGLLEMTSQHMERFHQLEEIEWKINFSIWALLGGFAYLWVTGRVTKPTWFEWLSNPYIFLLAPIPAMLVHGAAVFMLNQQQRVQANLRDHYREQVEELVSKPIQKNKSSKSLRFRDWCWIGWAMLVTFVLVESVLFLMLTTTPTPKP